MDESSEASEHEEELTETPEPQEKADMLRAGLAAISNDIRELKQDLRHQLSTFKDELKKEVLEALNDRGVYLRAEESEICHTLGKPSESGFQKVIMKLVSRKTKIRTMINAKKLKGTGIYINEHLTKRNADIAKTARDLRKRNKMEATWTRDCKIFIKTNEGKVSIVKDRRVAEVGLLLLSQEKENPGRVAEVGLLLLSQGKENPGRVAEVGLLLLSQGKENPGSVAEVGLLLLSQEKENPGRVAEVGLLLLSQGKENPGRVAEVGLLLLSQGKENPGSVAEPGKGNPGRVAEVGLLLLSQGKENPGRVAEVGLLLLSQGKQNPGSVAEVGLLLLSQEKESPGRVAEVGLLLLSQGKENPGRVAEVGLLLLSQGKQNPGSVAEVGLLLLSQEKENPGRVAEVGLLLLSQGKENPGMHAAFSGRTVRRKVKQAGVWQTKTVPVPDAVLDYNRSMGGVDVSDALIGYYSVLHKTMKWYKTFFYPFLDIVVVNSFLLHKELYKMKSDPSRTKPQKTFREQLAAEMLEYAEGSAPPHHHHSHAGPCFMGKMSVSGRTAGTAMMLAKRG
ncbi:hypothetical protein F7725_001416 [Dissostichus mawsoni]|uniref:PiggyBac transposable element-derived protein domain-containing protein n=1 Tax=Dissostichus mawsoni TaxID=36200 RepID=A0A7J5ZJB9_DISMA|nr:hypothetical protein F7725_001416 [Dissostichus mawsoni]